MPTLRNAREAIKIVFESFCKMRLFEWFFKHCETGFWVFKMLLFLLPTKDDNRANWCDKQLGKWPINDALEEIKKEVE